MPKTEIDYSNTIIYKITCNDRSINDLYVGHTTNFVQRKHAHKNGCTNEKSSNHNCKLYKAIRTNGGWDNWNMEIIAFCKCNDHYEARIKEQEYFTSLNATLNSIEPMPKPKPPKIQEEVVVPIKKVYYCKTCNIKCQNSQQMETHNQSKKHLKKTTINVSQDTLHDQNFKKNSKKRISYTCAECHFITCNKNDYTRHINTKKHIVNVSQCLSIENTQKHSYECDNCGKLYKDNSGLWKHKQKCTTEKCNTEKEENVVSLEKKENEPINEIQELKEFMKYLMKENSDMKNMMMEVMKMVLSIIK